MTLAGYRSVAGQGGADRTDLPLIGIGACGGVVALAVGVAAGTGNGPLLGAALLSLAAAALAVAVYVRDPVRAVIGFWIVVVLTEPVTTLAGSDSAGGQAVRHATEVVAVLLVVLTVWRTLRTNTHVPLRFLVPAVVIAVCGLLGAALHHVPLSIAIPGAWLGLKFWAMVGVTLVLPWKRDDINRVYTVVTRIGLVVAIYGFADFLTGNALSRALHLEAFTPPLGAPRSDSVHSIFSGPNEYSVFMSLLFALTFARFAGKHDKRDLALAALFAVSVLLTLRLKGFLSLVAVVLIVTLVYRSASSRRTIAAVVAGVVLCGGIYALEAPVIASQVSLYTSTDQTARAQLYSTGERIAVDDFPLGVGFGRFASYLSRYDYSPVYDQYYLSSLWGLSRTNPSFIDDQTWPGVIGETGFAGLAAYAVGFVLLALTAWKRLRAAPAALKWVPLGALCALGVLLADSLGDPTFFDWLPAATCALILGPAFIATRPASEAPKGTPVFEANG